MRKRGHVATSPSTDGEITAKWPTRVWTGKRRQRASYLDIGVAYAVAGPACPHNWVSPTGGR
jgi:hypothetical protein